MKDSEDFDDIVLADEIDREWESPHQYAASIQKNGRIGQWALGCLFYGSVQLEEELDT
jgi:hypothetical protein